MSQTTIAPPTVASLYEVIAFTGPRSFSENFKPHFVEEIKRILQKIRPLKAITGMALGIDLLAAEIALEAKIELVAHVPFEGQELQWPDFEQLRYKFILGQCKTVKVIWPNYEIKAFHIRNQSMIDAADCMIGIWTGVRSGGTFSCLEKIVRSAKPCILIRPDIPTVLLTSEELGAILSGAVAGIEF